MFDALEYTSTFRVRFYLNWYSKNIAALYIGYLLALL